MKPLQALAVRKFRDESKSFTIKNPAAGFADAAKLAYEYAEPTKDIRSQLVDVAVANKLFTSWGNGFETYVSVRECPELATDIALAALSVSTLRNYQCSKCHASSLREWRW